MKNLFIIILAFLSLMLNGQEKGLISGQVFDYKLNEPLFGATVKVLGTTKGGITDFNGRYSFQLNEGNYDIVVSYISYANDTLNDIKITAGETLSLDFNLKDATALIKTVVVQANKVQNTENAILIQQQKSDKIQDGISKEELSRSSASNVADGAKKVTGVSVQEGKYISVRGLGDRYTNAQLNGQNMSSTDPDNNSPQLDLIPAALLDNIVVSKTFTPDQSAHFTGGNVNIKTKDFPNSFFVNLKTSFSYNTQSNMRQDFLSYDGGRLDYLGYDDGSRKLPEILNNEDIADILTKGFYIKARNNDSLATILDDVSKAFNSEMTPREITSPLNHGVSFSIGNVFKNEGHQFGYIFTTTFNSKYNSYNDGVNAQWQLNDANAEGLNRISEFKDHRSSQRGILGSALKLAYGWNPEHTISLDLMYNHSGEKGARYQFGQFPGVISNSENIFETRSVLFKERSLLNAQVAGKHNFKKIIIEPHEEIEINWGLAVNQGSQLEPDLRFFANDYSPDLTYYISPSEYDLPFHYFRTLQDNVMQAKIDIKIPFARKSDNNYFKMGMCYDYTQRSFIENRYQVQLKDGLNYAGDAIEFFGENNTGIIDYNQNTGRYTFGNYLSNESILANNYNGQAEIMATYMMTSANIIDRLKFVGGARMEITDYLVQSADSNMTAGEINELDVLPSMNFIYDLDDSKKWKLRWSYNKTLARPSLREIAPYTANDFIGGFNLRGNPELIRSKIDNFDLRIANYPKPGELWSFSAYYKFFKDPIIKTFTPLSSNAELSFQNVDEAELYGLEFEMRKSMSTLHNSLKNFKLALNLTYVYSKSDIDSTEYEIIKQVNPEFKPYRSFQGQSPYLANLGLMYDNDSLLLSAFLSANYYDDRLTEVSLFGTPDIYERGRVILDLSVNKGFGKYITLSFNIKNILNSSFQKYLSFNSTNYVCQSYLLGRTYGFSVKYSIN